MKEKRSQHRQGGVMEGKGFYIVLFLCVAAIGISGYYLFSGLTAPVGGFGSDQAAILSAQADLQTDPSTSQTPPAPQEEGGAKDQQTAAPEKELAESREPEAGQDAPAQQEPQVPTLQNPDAEVVGTAYVWPVEGEVHRDFSLEVFAYDDTMGDWRTHSGLDIAAELGAPVCSCAGGTVSDISADPMMGTTITVDHGKGMESVYANLAESVHVQVGDAVEAGSVIGTVGTTAIAESASPSHLHFEMVEYDVSIDPLNYLH